jgi:nucleotide-binding universal stress UspA family protein
MIVCGVDKSDAAHAVAETARWLADALDARLLVLYVTEEPSAEDEEFLADVREWRSIGAEDVVRLVQGTPAERLLDAVNQDGAELLVVGSRGQGPIGSKLFGSVSRTLATDATRPVVVVPPESTPRTEGQGSIVCGIDGSDHAVAAARLAADLASRMGYTLLIVHALAELQSRLSYAGARGTTPPASAQPDTQARLAQEIVDAAVAAAGPGATGVVEAGLPWDVLESVAEREDGRLIVVAGRGLSAVRAAAFGSVASKLATSSRVPVLILPEPAEAGARAENR